MGKHMSVKAAFGTANVVRHSKEEGKGGAPGDDWWLHTPAGKCNSCKHPFLLTLCPSPFPRIHPLCDPGYNTLQKNLLRSHRSEDCGRVCRWMCEVPRPDADKVGEHKCHHQGLANQHRLSFATTHRILSTIQPKYSAVRHLSPTYSQCIPLFQIVLHIPRFS